MSERLKRLMILSGVVLLLMGQIHIPSMLMLGKAETQAENTASNSNDDQEEVTDRATEDVKASTSSNHAELAPPPSKSQLTRAPSLKDVPAPPILGADLDGIFNPPQGFGGGIGYLSNNALQLSNNINQVGAIWAKKKLNLNKPFSMTFYLYLGSSGFNAADGMTLTFQTKAESWIGGRGQELGTYDSLDFGKRDLLALEFDTYYNGSGWRNDNDLNYPGYILNKDQGHIAFRTSGSARDPHLGTVEPINLLEMSNGSWKKVEVVYTTDGSGVGTISYEYTDLKNGLKRNAAVPFNYNGKGPAPFFDGSEVFWGFTASTGAYWEENAVAFQELPKQGKIEAKDSSIYVGQKWSPSDNFLSGSDSFGKVLDVKDLQIYVDGKLNGTLDTNKPGTHKIKYEYIEQTNGQPDYVFEKEITVTVLQSTYVTAQPQVLKYVDNDASKFNPKDFVAVKDEKGKPLSNYTARFLAFPNSLDGKEAVVEITDSHGQKFTVNVPVTYEFANSINLLGRSDDRVATFSLDPAGKRIVATYNYSSAKTPIHRNFSDTYYTFEHFWQKTIASGSLNTQKPNYAFSAKGTDLLNTLDQFDGDRILGVSPGDVVKIQHKEGGKLLQNYVNNVSEGNSPAKEMLYEITTKGFKTLVLNRLTPITSPVLQGTSRADLDKNLSKYLPVTGKVKIVGFKTYPDVSKRGTATGVVTVKEDLSNGTSATWDYTVKFDVQKQFDSVTAKKQVLKYGNDKGDYDPKNFVEVKDASGKVTSDFNATFTSFPNSLNGKEAVVEVTPKKDTLDEKYSVKVPVTYEFGNSINLEGRSDDRVATFSLNDAATKITATYNAKNGKTSVHKDFSDLYYSFDYFGQKRMASQPLNDAKSDYHFSAKGTDLLNTLDQFDGDRILGVSPGDVIKIYHRESGYRFQNHVASVSQGAQSQKEVYFEIAKDGYRELNLNKLSPKTTKIKWQATKTEMDKVAQQLVDTSAYPNLKLIGYTQYPDTSKTGKQVGKIKVEETLVSGKKVTYTYDIMLDVQPFDNTDPDSHEPKNPNMWLNIEVPLEMTFNSTETSKHQKIEGSVGKVKNHSGRPVQVAVKSFTDELGGKADMFGIDSLVLNGDALTMPLDLKNFLATPQALIALESPAKDGQNVGLSGVSEVNLRISGTVMSTMKGQHHSTNKVELLFTPLDKDGKPKL
ncbi:hypothetical protein FACS1894193_08190 [Bacilli bacterium]|nr:hypothetical protein FACS1894192_02650 [Bacilli bacterium]GHU42587.1 hypothetical protein FACS1894193_08190 [Bacilli bacterium]